MIINKLKSSFKICKEVFTKIRDGVIVLRKLESEKHGLHMLVEDLEDRLDESQRESEYYANCLKELRKQIKNKAV